MYIDRVREVVAVQAIIIITGHKTKTKKKVYKIQLERCFV